MPALRMRRGQPLCPLPFTTQAPKQWQLTLTRAMASASASATVDALIDAAVTSSVVRALQASVEELQSKEAAMVEQMGSLIQKNAQLRMECKISEQGRKSAEQEHERVSGRLEELQEDMLWSGGDDETAAAQPPVQRRRAVGGGNGKEGMELQPQHPLAEVAHEQ